MVTVKTEENCLLVGDDFIDLMTKMLLLLTIMMAMIMMMMMMMIILMAYENVVATWKRRSRPNALVKASAPRRSASTCFALF